MFPGYSPASLLGRKRKVICVDFSVGVRYEERGMCLPEGGLGTQLVALRLPELILQRSDGQSLPAGDGCDNGKVEPGHICVYQGRLGMETGCPGVLAADTNNYLTFTADDCRIPCGDGIRHIVAGEECDDGNIINGDGCTSDCRIETGYTCPTVGWPQVLLTPCRAICGDGLRLGEEECDDNNTVAGDGCGPDCKVELGWFCKRKPDDTGEVCLNTCLNGIIDPGEECDDANTFSDDGCDNCIVEPGWSCEVIANRQTSTSSGSYCVPVCGDGFRIESGPMAEQCDDGNNLAGDGCDPSCHIETGWTCVSQASEVNTSALRCEPVCGDGLLVVGEGCDDGNKDSGDGCSASCQVERGFVCSPEDYLTKSEVATGPPFAAQNRTVCIPICGDGLVLLTFGEACDDGNRVPGDGCDENCAIEPGYTCGSGGVSSSSVCSPICGDGLLRSPEQCDDGNTGKGDGCNEQCQLEQGYQCWPPGVPCRFLCGDYLRLEGEACDDGNLALEDGCDSTCQVEDGWSCSSYIYDATNATSVCSPICGDGKIRGAEAGGSSSMPEARGVDFEVLQVPFDVKATALAPAGADGHFLAYCPNSGFQNINLVEQKMDAAMSFTGSISPEFGLFPYSQGNASWISFVENPPKSFVCYTSAGQVAGRTSFNQGTICAVCAAGEALVALLVTTGHIRFVDLTTGKAAGKFTKLPDIPRADRPAAFFINQTKPRQVVVMRQVRPGADVHVWICELDELNNINTGGRRTLKIGAVAQSLGAFNDLESISAGSDSGELILCWKEAPLTNGFLNGKSHGSHPASKKFCAAEVLGTEPKARRLGAFADGSIQSWHSIGTYFVEFWSQESDSAEAESAGTLKFRLRDSKFGMFVGAGDATLAKAPRGKLLVAASDRFSVASTNSCFVGIRWTLPSYALQRSIGQGASGRSLDVNSEGTQESKKKRKHQDTQNTQNTEDQGLPDVNAAFIADLIQLCQGPRTKDVRFLKQKLKPENLQFTLRTLVGWLSFRRDLSANVIRSSAPGIPATQQIVRFLSVLADAFLQSIIQLPTDDVQKVIERLVTAQNEACDDGNLVQGDGCDENCTVEAGWICCDPAPGTTGSRCSVGLPVDRVSICGVTCGNAQRENGEACDDGNRIAADGCSPGCEVEAGFACMPMGQQRPGRKIPDYCEAICGDGLLVVGEECDDGNQVSGDGCGPTCKIEQSGTACPPLSDSNGAVCRPTCGDGIRGPGEECDDANSFSGDGCSKDCLVERGFFCSGGGMRSRDTCWPICGDGLRVDRAFSATLAADKLEGCDTGAIPSRGCDAATCQIRPGWTCARPSGPGAEVCTPVCGDGIVISPMEECDDNNILPGDGCSPDCKVEALYECSYSSFFLRSVCQIRCGDGRKHPSEPCDDGNNWDQDGCSSDCQLEPGFECLGGTLASPSECKPICGDGFEVHGEGCDDGNLVPWDGCNQFCQVEDGYHCTRAPSPGGQGVVRCSKSCGDGIQNFDEECDDAAPGSSSSCFQCRKLPETVCGDFRRTDSEECDDGNTASGDGCSSSCTVEPGWNCVKGPSHLSPGTAPGDVCTPVCGDGLVVTGEACDDGNFRGDDGCTGDCQVEPLYDCFLPGATELLQVPASERPSNGPAASICVRTTPPRLQGARFDESFVTLELQFDSGVAPLPGEEYSGGVALAATSFSCSVLVDQNTLRLLGQGPRCWWKSRQVAAIALGSAPGLVPGSAVTLQAGVLRRYVFSQVTAPSQELKADVAGGMTAPVLWPRPVIWGPQLVPSCADSTTLNSDNSQGLAGRMALPSRWYVAGAFNITNGSWDSEELTRIEAGIVANAQEPQVIFPRQGALLSLVDLEYDRSLRVNYLYRICLQQENVLGLVGVSCHHLEVEELPVPIVEPLVPPGPYTLPRYGRWLNLELEAVVPKGCVRGDAPLPTTFLSGQAPEASHSLTLEEPLRPLQAAWSYDAALRTVYQQQAPAVTAVADAQSLGQDKTGSRSVDSRLSVEPGTFSAGFVNVHAGACINASKNLTENESSLGMLALEEVCGYYTFVINVQDLPAQQLSAVSSSRRASAVADQLLAAAAAGANLRLVGLAPSPGAAPEGPPLQAEEGKTPMALQHLDVLEDPGGNSRRAELLQFGWLGAVEPENDTTIIGVIPLAPTVGDNQFTQAELQAGLATLMPVVTWAAETRTVTQAAIEPPVPSVGGAFLSIPPQQLSPGSQVQVTAQLDLLPPNAGAAFVANWMSVDCESKSARKFA
eukprot:s1255_g31.t3